MLHPHMGAVDWSTVYASDPGWAAQPVRARVRWLRVPPRVRCRRRPPLRGGACLRPAPVNGWRRWRRALRAGVQELQYYWEGEQPGTDTPIMTMPTIGKWGEAGFAEALELAGAGDPQARYRLARM